LEACLRTASGLREIQDALALVTRKRKLDVIGFDACLMAMVETGYALRHAGKVLVGSEELEPGAGWNYERWLASLVADPAGYDAPKLGRLLVDSYRDEYGNNDDTTLSAVSLAKVSTLARNISAFADRARTKLTSQLAVLKKARRACSNYAPGYGLHSIDLGRFLIHVRDNDAAAAEIRSRARSAVKALEAAVIDN
jgi:hypothetical protein